MTTSEGGGFKTLIKSIKDTSLKHYVLILVRKEYDKRTDELTKKYDEKIVSYLKNFIYGKVNNLIKD